MRRLGRAALLVLLAGGVAGVSADTCMVSPTQKEVVSGRFGKFRSGGAGNFGSTNTRPHMHDGLDFSTSGQSQPLFATTDGVVTWAGGRGSAGNTVIIRRDDGGLVAYYHLSGFADGVRVGTRVRAGQQIGLSGNTNRGGAAVGGMAKHLHFVYGVPQRDQARAKMFMQNASRGAFNPSQLPLVFRSQADIGWKTDPSPYFCKTYPIRDGSPQLYPILGKDTKAQYAIMFGGLPSPGAPPPPAPPMAPPSSAPPSVPTEPVQVAAAHADDAVAAASGATAAAFLSDSDGYGALPTPPIGAYETMSTAEMLLTEATRRFSDAEWNTSILKVSSRALWVDYNRAVGVSAFLAEAIYRKKERIEALLAVYTSQRMASQRAQTEAARTRVQHDEINRLIP